jgi:hypothetical protein
MPGDACGLLVVVHRGEASVQHPGRRFAADVLQANGLATLTIALSADAPDLEVDARQLESALAWLAGHRILAPLPRAMLGWTAAAPACLAFAAGPLAVRLDSLVIVDPEPMTSSPESTMPHTPTLLVRGARSRHGVPVPAPHRRVVLAQATRPVADPGAYEAIACEALGWIGPHAGGTSLERHQPGAEGSAYDRFQAA